MNDLIELVTIHGGSFLMGSPDDEPDRFDDEGPQRLVTVPSFLMGKFPVTQAQWKAVAALPKVERDLDADPSFFKGDDLPVEQVSWHEAVEFCHRLSKKTGQEYRLPSEAEWEYACRAGTTTPYSFGKMLTKDQANFDTDSTTSVGKYLANDFGLSDMHGNVWEWCQDHWHDDYVGAPTDGSAWLSTDNNAKRLMRGGSWFNYPRFCRSAYRDDGTPVNRYDDIGFRVVCDC